MIIPEVGSISPQSNISALKITSKPRKTHLVLAIMPAWHILFPPYGLARLTGVAREAGYKVTVFDINLEASKYILDQKLMPDWKLNDDRSFKEDYLSKTHEIIKPVLDQFIQKIIELKPEVIGFTLYWSNEVPTYWIAAELKKRLPHTKIIIGGPSTHAPGFQPPECIDHWISADGEQSLLEFLEDVENENPAIKKHFQPQTKLDINFLPRPLYADFNLAAYQEPGVFPAEISRGCVAKCTFCASTHHWKYRYRSGLSAIEEVQFLVSQYKVTRIQFVDHLINGNLTELKAFSQKLIELNYEIAWNGFARCNGKMDLNYFKELKQAGCGGLSVGIESGSQKVLNAIRKNVKVEEIDRNLENAKAVGINVCALFIVGFPNEDTAAFAETLSLIWRNHKNIGILIFATRCDPDIGSVFHTQPELFNAILSQDLFFDWYTQDFKNTALNRIIRSKILQIALFELKNLGSEVQLYADREWVKKDYQITYQNSEINLDIPNEEFIYRLIQVPDNELAESVVNECWALFRTLWRAKGAFKMQLIINQNDCQKLGSNQSIDFFSEQTFEINNAGFWKSTYQQKLNLDLREVEVFKKDFSYDLKGELIGHWGNSEN